MMDRDDIVVWSLIALIVLATWLFTDIVRPLLTRLIE